MVIALNRKYPTPEKVLAERSGVGREQLNAALDKHGRTIRLDLDGNAT